MKKTMKSRRLRVILLNAIRRMKTLNGAVVTLFLFLVIGIAISRAPIEPKPLSPPKFIGNEDGVCIIPHIGLYKDPHYTEAFGNSVITTLKNVALRSIRMQKLSSTVKTVAIQLNFPSWNQHFTSKEEMNAFFKSDEFEHIPLDIVTDGESLEPDAIRNSSCKWIAFVRLDADDALGTDYFNYIGDYLVPNLLERKFYGKDYLGAVVASSHLPVLYYGFGHCDFNPDPYKNKHYSGFSVGQTRIYRKDVYEELTYRKAAPGVSHVRVIEHMRNIIMQQFMKDKEYKSQIYDKRDDLKYRQRDEDATAVKMIDVSKIDFQKPLGIYFQTPLSGNFPWRDIMKKPECTYQKQQEFLGKYDYSMDYSFIFDQVNTKNLTIMDACKSNVYFNNVQAVLMRTFKTCESLSKGWDKHVQTGIALLDSK